LLWIRRVKGPRPAKRLAGNNSANADRRGLFHGPYCAVGRSARQAKPRVRKCKNIDFSAEF
jgi:hypothetical protein